MLTRVAGLFAARGYNIDSLAVGPTETEGLSRMTIVVNVDESPLEQVTKQLNKLVNVIKILEHDPGSAVERELMLAKVHAQGDARARIMEICEVFRVNIVDVTATTLTRRGERQAREARGAPRSCSTSTASWSSRAPGASRSRAASAASGSARRSERRTESVPDDRPTGRNTEMATIYYEKDTDTRRLADQKIAILGFGSPGPRARAEPAGLRVRRAGRPASRLGEPRAGRGGRACACSTPPTPWPRPTSSCACCPTPATRKVYAEDIAPNLKDGDMLMFAHGFSIHFGTVVPPEGVDVTMIAPEGPRPPRAPHLRARASARRAWSPCSRTPPARRCSARWPTATGIGCARAGIIETTFKEETETDLFGEQTVLCGGLCSLIKNGFETLVAAGYQPEIAYFECLHELKLIVDLIYEGGLSWMRYSVSTTAEWGDYVSGPRVVDEHARAADGAGAGRDPGRHLRQATGSPRPTPASRSSSDLGTRRGRPSSRAWGASCAR